MKDIIKGVMYFSQIVFAFLLIIGVSVWCDRQIELYRESTLKEMGYSVKMINDQCFLYYNTNWIRCGDVLHIISAYPIQQKHVDIQK